MHSGCGDGGEGGRPARAVLLSSVLPDTADPQPGDFAVYDFSHIGIVKESRGDKFVAIEGNTNGAGSRDGDGVYLKTRPRKLARCFIRIRPSGS